MMDNSASCTGDSAYVNICCTGCCACVSICPLHIIEMQRDEEGYDYAVYDTQKCVHCNKCSTVCPALSEVDTSYERKIYAARAVDPDQVARSTSGAIFPMLAKAVIEQEGTVVGAQLDAQLRVAHTLASTLEQVETMRTSKYVQSDMRGIYEKIGQALERGPVLFAGCPCQTDAVRRYIKETHGKQNNLYLCDLICGKAASPGMWGEYRTFLEKHFGGKITKFIFRDKNAGYSYEKSYVAVDGRDVSDIVDAQYSWMELYTRLEFCRPACYHCPFTRIERNSDLTIGDFWGVEKVTREFNDEKGVSLIVVQSQKGAALLEKVRSQMIVVESDRDECLQERLKGPVKEPKQREAFWRVYQNGHMEELLNHYGRRGIVKRILRQMILPRLRKFWIYDVLQQMYYWLKY